MRTTTSAAKSVTGLFLLGIGSVGLVAGCVAQSTSSPPASGSPAGTGGSTPTGGSGAGATGASAGTGATGNMPAGSGGTGGSLPSGNGGTIVTGAGGAGTTGAPCTPLTAIPRRLWRLSTEQYSNATRDLLGLTAPVSVSSSTDGMSAYGLFSDTTLTVGDAILFSGFYQTAENILTQITPRLASIAACNASEMPTACASRFASEFGKRAFRRPLDTTEVANLMKVYTAGAAQDFNTGIGNLIEALILAPSFLYRTELGPATLTADATGAYPATTLTPYEVATQLGFLFLNSTPDATLLTAADNGTLGTPAGLTSQVSRLLAIAPVKTNLTNVFVNWFSLGQLGDKANKDTNLLSKLATADQDQSVLVGDLLTSAQQFINDTLWTNTTGKVSDLLNSQKVFVNQRLATLYGQPVVSGTSFVASTWAPTEHRIGMLTQPAFLWSVSASSATSIVKRGQFIHDDVVCQDSVGSPIDLSSPLALSVIAMGDSEITKSDARMTPGVVCSACHSQMDPYARVLQNFGPIGNYRTVDELNRPVDPSVKFSGTSPLAPQSIAGPTEFAQALIASKAFTGCAVQKMSSYAIGTMIRKYNTCELQDVRAQFDQSDGTATSLFNQIALSNFVRARAGGVK